jgi:hypothetical protein
MPVKAVTFAVQIGSGGFEIARATAEQLRFSYYDWEVTSQAAAEAGATEETLAAAEHAPSHLELVMENLLTTGVYTGNKPVGPLSAATLAAAIRKLESRQYRQLIEDVVRRLADRGSSVIVGHAGQVVLAKLKGVAKVLVCGSAEIRAERLTKEEALTLDQALKLVAESDQERANFFRRIYHVDLLNAASYDLVLNTDQINIESAVRVVSVFTEGISAPFGQ